MVKCPLTELPKLNFTVICLIFKKESETNKQENMAKPEYIKKNIDWLQKKGEEQGVHSLPNGILYKVVKKGNDKLHSPNKGSVVTVHYTGKTINGKTFDSSRGATAPAFRLRDLIPGWITALQNMHPGDRWEVYIP
ncbi:MAG: FKBP-type peptidyl-prolyl cis-trans isomerase, partial [Muribaculaceae bacterium]|nr:FKBP-type peptidyl-prolyl cis-trans isomerase [Muribaculaceae bacterium]